MLAAISLIDKHCFRNARAFARSIARISKPPYHYSYILIWRSDKVNYIVLKPAVPIFITLEFYNYTVFPGLFYLFFFALLFALAFGAHGLEFLLLLLGQQPGDLIVAGLVDFPGLGLGLRPDAFDFVLGIF